MSGYVRIHRSLIGHPAFRNDAEAMAFAWLVARAAWKPIRVRYKERAIHLGRGQLAISVRDFARAMDRDKAWIERLLKRLKAETMVKVQIETGLSVVTICNYAQYQLEANSRETVGKTPDETDARQGQDTEQGREEVKEVSSEAKASSPKTRASKITWLALPLDWVPTRALSPNTQTMVENWPPGAFEAELESFRAWAANAKPEKGKGLKKDWDDAFGNWIRSAHRDKYSRLGSIQRPRTNPLSDIYRTILDEEARQPGAEDHHGTRLSLQAAYRC
jgi:hypothetical protein